MLLENHSYDEGEHVSFWRELPANFTGGADHTWWSLGGTHTESDRTEAMGKKFMALSEGPDGCKL